MVHKILGKSLQTFHKLLLAHHQLPFTYIITLILSKLRKLFNIALTYSHLPTFSHTINLNIKFVEDQDSKISKASDSTPNKSSKYQSVPTPSKARVTHVNAKEGSSNVISDATPIIVVPERVPTKRGTKTPTAKRDKPSNIRNFESSVAIKKPHNMLSLYLEPIKTPNVEPDVVTSVKGPFVLNVIGSVGTSKKIISETVSLDNPRAEKTLGQSSLNVC